MICKIGRKNNLWRGEITSNSGGLERRSGWITFYFYDYWMNFSRWIVTANAHRKSFTVENYMKIKANQNTTINDCTVQNKRQARKATWVKISVWWHWSYRKWNILFLAPRNKPFCRVFTNATEYETWDFKQSDHHRDNCWSLLGTFWVRQPRDSSGLSWELRCDW